jgi:hypothetical protein
MPEHSGDMMRSMEIYKVHFREEPAALGTRRLVRQMRELVWMYTKDGFACIQAKCALAQARECRRAKRRGFTDGR